MKDFTIHYTDATVTHSNKYNQNVGVIISHFFMSNLLQDVVFKLDADGDEFAITLKNLNLLLYTGQKVTVVALDGNVIAYIDKQTNQFSYLSTNLQRDLNYGLQINWLIVAAITPLIYFLLIFFFRIIDGSIVIALPVCLWVYQRVINFILERKLDRMILNS